MASSTSFIPYLCVAAAAFITTFLTVPLVKRLAIKLDAVDYPSKRRINTKPIPRMGGTAVFLGLVVACIVQILGTWYLGWPPVLVPHPRLHISYPVLALSFTVIFATGAIDDVFQLKPKQKLAGQVLAALIACIGGLKIGVIINPFAPGEIMLGLSLIHIFVALYHKRRTLSQGKANRYCICTKMTTAPARQYKVGGLPADYARVGTA